ncbi:MAG TPA: CBS domain-containing protein [Dongiaceae bacterium]|nr:CBS domain-containing protein [Dongiaceae bacterium]
MKHVREILKSKAIKETFTVQPTTKVLEALRLMSEKGVGAMLVVENKRLVGIVTERDYARKVILMARSSHTATVSEIMTSDIFTVDPDQTIDECMELLTDKRVRHLPVIDEGRLIGLISIGDVVKNIISEQENTIQHLEQYIRGETVL